ncbi:MAG: SDR family NAD(P)-dependent oxidoreductase [Thermodesulfobacteriota bacterium]|nr:SDR family NAD(P)-dependent oxidoreductase [Thermodesulfobacteriota bacterium]
MNPEGRLQDKVALITGAASGIGRATAERFAREGATVVICDVNEDALKGVADSITQAGGTITGIKADVSFEAEVQATVSQTLERYSRIDILVNNAGIIGEMTALADMTPDGWRQVFDVNLLGAVLATKYVAPHMQQQQSGAVVNVASVAGIRSGAGPNAYSASKAALINFTRTTACDLGSFNVRVNAVCPGLIETGMTKPVFDYARSSGKIDKVGNRCELRRYGLPEEIAAAILFLASHEASYITGQALPVDGGNTASLNMPGMKF